MLPIPAVKRIAKSFLKGEVNDARFPPTMKTSDGPMSQVAALRR
jgi:hypothetical protein